MPSLVLFVTLLVSPLWAQSPYPQVQGRVNDFAQAIDASTKTKLNALLVQVYQQTTAEIAVVVETTAPATPKQYVTALFNQWGWAGAARITA